MEKVDAMRIDDFHHAKPDGIWATLRKLRVIGALIDWIAGRSSALSEESCGSKTEEGKNAKPDFH
jgi:hypothetical protein